jgi:hypothetical protein
MAEPHVLIFIDVPDEAGKVVTWGFENSNVHRWRRRATTQ